MSIKRVPIDEIKAIIKRLESEGRHDDAELFRKAIYGGRYGRIRVAKEATSHTVKIG